MSELTPKQKELFERLAAIEHERWSDWQAWCHKILRDSVPSKELDAVLARWDRQTNTKYCDLSEKEKDSDRQQVYRYWSLIAPDPRVEELTKAYENMKAALRRVAKKNQDLLDKGGVDRALKEELDRLKRDYQLFEEISPPDVPRTEFVDWCYDAWDKQQETHGRVEKLVAAAKRCFDWFQSDKPEYCEPMLRQLADALAEFEKEGKND